MLILKILVLYYVHHVKIQAFALIASFQFLKQIKLVSFLTNQVTLVQDLNIDDLVDHLPIFLNQEILIIAKKGAFRNGTLCKCRIGFRSSFLMQRTFF